MKSTAVFDEETKCALLSFRGFLMTNDFIAIADQAHVIRKKHNSNKQLNNIEDMSVLTQEVQTYLKEKWFPEAVKTGLKHFAFVIPKNAMGQMSMKNANKEAEKKPEIEIKYFDNEPEAKAWLKSK